MYNVFATLPDLETEVQCKGAFYVLSDLYAYVDSVRSSGTIELVNGSVRLYPKRVSEKLIFVARAMHDEPYKVVKAGTRYDWSKAPSWAKYIATDSSGAVWAYADKPTINDSVWKSGIHCERSERIEWGKPFCKDFESSLEERPNNV